MTTQVQMTEVEARALFSRWADEPVTFCREALGFEPWEKQIEIMNSVRWNPRTAVKSCSGGGKSTCDAALMIWFLYCFPPATVVQTAPTARQVKDIVWKEVHSLYHNARIPLGGKLLDLSLNLDEKQKYFAIGLTTKEKERFLGYHNKNVFVVADEASGVPEDIFEAIENPLSSGFTRFLLTGNPTKTGGTFQRAFDDENSSYNCIHIGYQDTPNFRMDIPDVPALISPQWVEEKKKDWGVGSPLWQVYIMGEFSLEETGALIPAMWIEEARKRELQPDGPIVMGVDTAGDGEDENVVIIRQGPRVIFMDTWHSQDIMVTANKVRDLANLWKVNLIQVDKAPIGQGVIDRLGEQKYNVIGVRVGDPSYKPTQFINIRAQGYWELRELFQNGEIDILDDKETFKQLQQVHYEVRAGEQKIQIEKKKDMKKRTGANSPDRADAMMLAFWNYRGKEPEGPRGGIACRQF